jgi:ribosomal-protein-alanine N-acetyltransferase
MNFNIIPTERLLLLEMNPATYKYVFSHYADDQLMKFFGLKNKEELKRKKDDYENGLTMFNKSFCYFQLLDKRTEGFIGWCGYHTWYIRHFRAEIGYGLTEEHERRKGYMKEALPEVIKYGFEQMNLNRIEALIGPDNIASLNLVHRFGFIQEGILREHYCKNGLIEDSLVYSLLKNEFITK